MIIDELIFADETMSEAREKKNKSRCSARLRLATPRRALVPWITLRKERLFFILEGRFYSGSGTGRAQFGFICYGKGKAPFTFKFSNPVFKRMAASRPSAERAHSRAVTEAGKRQGGKDCQ